MWLGLIKKKRSNILNTEKFTKQKLGLGTLKNNQGVFPYQLRSENTLQRDLSCNLGLQR